MGNICLEIGGSLEAVSGGEDISAGAHRPRAGLGKVAELENPEDRGYFFILDGLYRKPAKRN